MDNTKVKAMNKWPASCTVKDIQVFSGVCTFLLVLYTKGSARPESSPEKGPKRLLWNTAAKEAFTTLKTIFTMVPIYQDTTKPSVVEWNASELGVGAILSQHFGEQPKLHPVAFSW